MLARWRPVGRWKNSKLKLDKNLTPCTSTPQAEGYTKDSVLEALRELELGERSPVREYNKIPMQSTMSWTRLAMGYLPPRGCGSTRGGRLWDKNKAARGSEGYHWLGYQRQFCIQPWRDLYGHKKVILKLERQILTFALGEIIAPRMCFGACEHQHGLPVCDQRGADYAETLAMCRSRNGSQTARFPVPKQGRCCNGSKLALEPEISGFATVCCAEVVQNRVRMSVCLMSVQKIQW